MDIKSVFDELQKAAEKNNKLYTEIADKSKVIAANVVKNYYEIVQPVETELAHLLKNIRETARFIKTPPFDGRTEDLFLGPEVNEDKVSLSIKTTWRGVFVVYHADGYGELWQSIYNAKEHSLSLTDAKLTLFAPWLASEEKANELAELVKKAYIPLLEWHKQQFEEIGSDLSSTVEHLQKVLDGSHTVEEKEDGTVKIQLGGKTYIGRLEEEAKNYAENY